MARSEDGQNASSNSSRIVLHPAESYFDIDQAPGNALRSNGTHDSTQLHDRLTVSEIVNPAKVKSLEQYQNLGLTGNIISATAQIPYIVGIQKDGHFEIKPRQHYCKLHQSLSYLSSSTGWKHTVVGWTGEVLSALSAEFGSSKRRDDLASPTTHEGAQIGKTVIHDVNSSGLKESFVQHLKDGDKSPHSLLISKEQRRQLETLLEHVFEDKILPVWLGDWSEDQKDALVLKDQHRWRSYMTECQKTTKSANGDHVKHSQTPSKAYADYKRMNESVADAILKVYNPGDIIWIHDCNLMLVPGILRRKLPTSYICYYHHSDDASGDLVTSFDEHAELLTGLLGASVIGLPTRELRHHFEDYFQTKLHLEKTEPGLVSTEGRHVALIHVPIMIGHEAIPQAIREHENVRHAMEAIRQANADKRIIVALAVQDQPQGLWALLDGYDYLLERGDPTLRKKTVLFLITTLDPPHYSAGPLAPGDLDAESSWRIVKINGKHGGALYQPIVYMDGTSPPWEYIALLRLADLGVVTSVDERVYAMAVEFIVSQEGKCSPLLVCGQQSLQKALNAESLHHAEVGEPAVTANKLEACLKMCEQDKHPSHNALYNHFAQQNSRSFTNEYLLRACNSFAKAPLAVRIPKLEFSTLHNAFSSIQKRLFMFDYDGTLTPIINDPNAALPTEKLIKSLPKLANRQGSQVWIISGRSRDFLQKHFGGIDGVGLSAEHGSFVRRPGKKEWENLAAQMDMQWKVEADKVFSKLEQQVDGSWIERKEVAIVWHYRNATDHEACLAKAVDSKALLEGEKLKGWDVDVMLGKANLEVRPRFLNKGAMAASLIKELFGTGQDGFVFCAGDDTTDEDMFRALLMSRLNKAGVFSCLVSKNDRPSLASFRVDEPCDLIDAVALLSEA